MSCVVCHVTCLSVITWYVMHHSSFMCAHLVLEGFRCMGRGRVWFSLSLLLCWGSISLWCPWMIGEVSGDVSVEMSVDSVMLMWSTMCCESVLGVSSRQWVPGMISHHHWGWRFRELVYPRQTFELFLIYYHFWCNISLVQLFWG